MVLRAAEAVRIALSNSRAVDLALPSTEEGWLELNEGNEVLVTPSVAGGRDLGGVDFGAGGETNSTHSFHRLSRKEMEKLCASEFQDLIRPIREVAIMAGALLPGDASPTIVESALEKEKELAELEKFYYDGDDDDDGDRQQPGPAGDSNDNDNGSTGGGSSSTTTTNIDIDIRSAKKAQQKGRKKARETAKRERKYRAESRKARDQRPENTRVRAEGISGRPISRIVLVGGATRMPTIGRIISSLTGVTPQRTVDPDEAVALGCAVHAGVLDGKEEMGVVLNPMKAALLRAAIEKERREGRGPAGATEDGVGDESARAERF